MPLTHGKSSKAFGHNVEAEMHAGKPLAQSLAIAYATKRRAAKKMARGGFVEEEEESGYEPHYEEADMIARILHKRKEYSEGGQVANDVGVAEADKDPAEFDDLVLRDDLEDDSDAGNETGDEAVDHEQEDIISRIRRSQRKRDHKMPRPA
jgi:hypothetical protein